MITVTWTAGADMMERMRRFPKTLEGEMQAAMEKSVLMVEGEAKRRTPVDTGYLRSSIGGTAGFHKVQPFFGSAGTNVEYAYKQHEGNYAHRVGERKFIEKGLKASGKFIEEQLQKALDKAATKTF